MVVNEHASLMLLAEPFFKGFTTREPCDTTKYTEALMCFSATSRAEVDAIVERALANGGTAAMPTQDHGWMYGRSFYDLDGHREVAWMDPAGPR